MTEKIGAIAPLPRASLRDRVYGMLLDAIIVGELAPGARLLDQELATRFSVSRTPVREALQRLEDDGLVESAPGAYTRVTPLDAQEARDAFPVVASLHGLAARLAHGRVTAAQCICMRQANRALSLALRKRDASAAIRADDAFHDVLIEASENIEIKRTLDRLMPRVRRLEYAQFGLLGRRESVEEHDHILAACREGTAQALQRLVEQNWLSLGKLLIRSFKETDDGNRSA